MIKKVSDIFSFINDCHILEKKFLLKNFYYKYLITETTFKSKNNDCLVSNFDEFSKKTICLPKVYLKKKYLLGYSLNLINYKFKGAKQLNYSLNLPVSFQNFFFSKGLNNLYLELFKRSIHFILFVSAVKGGYIAYSNTGIKGFLPYSQAKYLQISNTIILKSLFLSNKFRLLWFCIKFFNFRLAQYRKNFRSRFKGRLSSQSFIFLIAKRKKFYFNKFYKKSDKKNVKESSIKKKVNYFKKKRFF